MTFFKNENMFFVELTKEMNIYIPPFYRDYNYSRNNYSSLRHMFFFISDLYKPLELIDECLNDLECEGMGTNSDRALEKGPNQTIFLFDGLNKKLQEKIDKGIDADWTKEPYDFLDDSNSICMQEENFIDCLKKWDWIKRNKPQYVLFWRKKVGDDVFIESFEQEDEVNKRIEELETIVAN